MNVGLAVQVLSDSVGNVLLFFCSPDSHGTSNFCLMMDKFFDCMNVRNTSEHLLKAKPFLKPYKSTDDERLNWLDQFLEYLRFGKFLLMIDLVTFYRLHVATCFCHGKHMKGCK